MEESEALASLNQSGAKVQIQELESLPGTNSIQAVEVDCGTQTRRNILVFVHGSPGNWIHYLKYMKDPELRKTYCIISLNRPGFRNGESDASVPDPEEQAKRISASVSFFLSKLSRPIGKHLVIVGHSYGGPIAGRIATLLPSHVTEIVLLAAALDPEQEEIKWYNKFANSWVAKNLLPKSLIVSNDEMLPLKEQLATLQPTWSQLKAKAYIIQGEKDTLVSPENLEFAKRVFPEGTIAKAILLSEQDHFLPWREFDLIKQILLEIPK
ncbi:hypothetical protein CH373_14340 [Leptospira perolatii]|uniref:AB hydrolase-1 domain-containing protein n=2 Tax=Leptospira perolatii TaxID=2023191 RepID=A0A2M9ZK47_9LEPT|nr:hypothetical protein CH360_12280 [Leptospira perolatii]PJZ72429.1 hypothetical protein CH373_14340 [Leptospira perolatii]